MSRPTLGQAPSFWRVGHVRNGRFPDTSEGKGPTNDFFNIGIKRAVSTRSPVVQFISANAAYLNRPPTSNNAFISARTRPNTIPGLQSETVMSGDHRLCSALCQVEGTCDLLLRKLTVRLVTLLLQRRGPHHRGYSMSGVDQMKPKGWNSAWRPTDQHMANDGGLRGATTATPRARKRRSPEQQLRGVCWRAHRLLENYKVGGMPQTAASLGFRYNSPKFWFAGVNGEFLR